ncbi:hypothetical protein ABMC88_10235 [Sulfitobacter sp. HNIBRBA2951]|uniref:hypothetical protein n=1 Tax=Sulfitobacter aquimarinus TaxID=3158557 RepID=UPI0032E00275
MADQKVKVWMKIARHDNIVVPRRQRMAAEMANATVTTIEDGHYVQRGDRASEFVDNLWFDLVTLD